MADWTSIPDSVLEIDKPIRSIDITALRDNIIAAIEGAANAPGWPRVLLYEETVAVARAEIDLTDFDTSYPQHLVELDNFTPSVDATHPGFRMSIDNGATFEAGATSYRYTAQGYRDDAVAINDASAGLSVVRLNGSVGIKNSTEWGYSGEVRFWGLGRTGRRKRCTFHGAMFNNGDDTQHVVGQAHGVVAALRDNIVNGLRFSFFSGNVQAGSIIRLWGLKQE